MGFNSFWETQVSNVGLCMTPAHIRSYWQGRSQLTPLNGESQVEFARLYAFNYILRTNKDISIFLARFKAEIPRFSMCEFEFFPITCPEYAES